MPDPTVPQFAPVWLAPESVKEWLHIDPADTTDDTLIRVVCAMSEPYVERCRPEFIAPGGGYKPDAEAYQGAVMYAAREFRRQNSPGGLEVFGDQTSFVTRYDTDIERALHTGAYAPPVTA